MNLKISNTFDLHRLILNLTDEINLNMISINDLSNLNIGYT